MAKVFLEVLKGIEGLEGFEELKEILQSNFQPLYTLHSTLSLGVPLRVGLSAISFSAALQKDAAPIPNALAATNSMISLTINNNS